MIKIRKTDGELAKSDKENAEVFFTHFDKIFNSQHVPCDPLALNIIKDRDPKDIAGDVPTIEEIINTPNPKHG